MAKYSLKARMMILILAPTLLIGLSLSVFFAVHRYHELQSQLINSGINIIEPLAIASEYGVAFHNRNAIKQLVGLLHRRHSDVVRAIAVYDAQNNLFVSSNHHYNYNLLQLPKDEELPTHLTLTQEDNSLILRTPIIAENHLITEEPPHTLPLGYVVIELDLRLLHLQQYKESFTAFLLLLISLCIALLFAYRLMRDVTRPIRNMVNTVDRIRRGQLDSRVNGHMLGELDMLKNGINSMAMSLTAYHEEMQQNIDQATSDLRETLDQMEIQNIELDLAKRRAQEAARIKSEFLANMSHELRTPLNGVLGFTRQVLKTPLNIIQTDYLQAIEKSANNLLNIINDILDFSKLEAGKLVLEHIPFLLRETVDEVALLLAPSAHDKGLELTLAIHQDVPEYVIGDPMRLQQIITNLLGNAIKFTEKGNIDICIEQHGFSPQQVELEFRIHDTGVGISERQQSQLFQAFRQADASISRRHGGTGLGLVITQKLVNEMRGAISFHSQYGQGSTFWFHIKLELDPHALIEHIKMDPLMGQRLLYVEANPTAAECGLDLLQSTPLEISHLSSFDQRPPNAHYDILLIGLPPDFQLNQADQQHQLLAILSLADQVILAIPSHLSLESEKLRTLGIQSCLSKPLARNRLLPALLDNTAPKRSSQLVEHQKECLPLTVMAVDDNPANLKLIGTLLNEMVTHTLLCQNGEEAISQANKHSLDVILMDIQMPELDGISTSELIRKQTHHMNTPIIAVTAHAISGERERLLQAGMDDYLAKPIDENMLRQILLRYYRQPQSVDFCAAAPSSSISLYSPNQALDWRLALRQAANKEELARELLQMLLDFLPQVTLQIKSILNGEPNETIMDTIHKLHGSCSYSGVPRLKQLCYYLEQQLCHHTKLSELEPEWMELLDEIENVIQAATAKLAEH